MKELTILPMNKPKKILMYLNHEIKYPILIQKTYFYVVNHGPYLKICKNDIIFQYTVPIQGEKIFQYIWIFIHIISNGLVNTSFWVS